LAIVEIVERLRPQLFNLCRRHHVRTLELFGSGADGAFDPDRSDLDFLIEFLPEAEGRVFHGYFDFKAEVKALFGRQVDLVMPSAIRNRYFKREVEKQRRLVYAA
jgi:predicted nucleotidyltransferase